MSDQQNRQPAGNPWMRPTNSQQLIRNDTTRRNPVPVSPYTPNEPDRNEAVYAARAAAARQQAAARQTAPAPSPVQQALDQAAQQAHAARQSASLTTDRYARVQQEMPAQPAAVFYQQSTGAVQPARQEAAQPARPAQPHRLPMDAWQQPRQEAPAASITRQVDAAALADPMLAEEAVQTATSRRRSRMVMRQEREMPAEAPAAFPPVSAQEAAAAQPDPQPMPAPAQEPVLETIPPMPQLSGQPDLLFSQDTAPATSDTPAQPLPSGDPADDLFAEVFPETVPEIKAEPAADDFRLPENPLKDYSWYDEPDEDEPEGDCVDTSSMPVPAPVSTLDIPKVRRGKRLFTLLLVVMLLAAAGAFLWLSGYGEKLYHSAIKLVDSIQNPTVPTGPMNVTPESAALPATLTVTVTTDSTVTALKLLDDTDQPLAASVTSQAQGDQTLWTCSVRFETPYEGFLRAQLLGEDGQWHIGSEKRHVALN